MIDFLGYITAVLAVVAYWVIGSLVATKLVSDMLPAESPQDKIGVGFVFTVAFVLWPALVFFMGIGWLIMHWSHDD